MGFKPHDLETERRLALPRPPTPHADARRPPRERFSPSTGSGHRRLTFSYFHWEGAGYPAAAFGLTTMINQAAIRARSWLFTPATRPDRFAKGAAAGADVVILDLEDAVAPKDKAEARATALDYLAGNPADGALHALRINGLNTQSGISDLDALLGSSAAPNFVVLPKTETAGHLQILDRLLTAAGPAEQSGTQNSAAETPFRIRRPRPVVPAE